MCFLTFLRSRIYNTLLIFKLQRIEPLFLIFIRLQRINPLIPYIHKIAMHKAFFLLFIGVQYRTVLIGKFILHLVHIFFTWKTLFFHDLKLLYKHKQS